MTDPDSEYILRICTCKCIPLRCLFECIKEILGDTVLCFSEQGIKNMDISGTKTVISHVFLHADQFEEYTCKRPIRLGINTNNVFNILKGISNDDTLTLAVREQNPNILEIYIKSNTKHSVTNVHYTTLDIEYTDMTMHDIETMFQVNLHTKDFQNMCSSMNIADRITFRCYNGRFSAQCVGDGCTIERVFFEKGENGIKLYVNEQYRDKIVSSTYVLKFIQMFIKATRLCEFLDLIVGTVPGSDHSLLVVKYSVGNLGKLTFMLNPVLTTT